MRVPEAAGIDPAGVSGGWVNRWPVLINRASGRFFGYYDAEYALVLKLPESVRRLALATTDAKGEHRISTFPALGDEWIRCPLRDAQDDPRWLAAAYAYAQS